LELTAAPFPPVGREVHPAAAHRTERQTIIVRFFINK
jgi:hypothetical protein